MQVGDKVQVRTIDQIVKPLHGQFGQLTGWSYHSDHNGPYTMFKVKLDRPVSVGGGIMLQNLFMPSTCFDFNLFRKGIES